ncbi:MAG TPA: pyridoxal 5'-phosphate synthase glutaminase subunit PdxT [Solirubrobacteraceae bacterium]|nr:pyridoxal 5'-phosphate synthase glutaminase subunit PdxT [Solirubrobacteraceae bacterium]
MSDSPPAPTEQPLIGVLALQGDFEAHTNVLRRFGAQVREVRVVADLNGIDGLVIPGGESTTMTLGIAREGLAEPIATLVSDGLPVLGSCAGLIMLDRAHLGVMDIVAERNAFGRQIKSFESDLEIAGLPGGQLRGLFIRAPWIAEHGPGVEILADVEGHAVAAREGRVLAVAFHSELGDDDRLHAMLLGWARDYAEEAVRGAASLGGAVRSSAIQP